MADIKENPSVSYLGGKKDDPPPPLRWFVNSSYVPSMGYPYTYLPPSWYDRPRTAVALGRGDMPIEVSGEDAGNLSLYYSKNEHRLGGTQQFNYDPKTGKPGGVEGGLADFDPTHIHNDYVDAKPRNSGAVGAADYDPLRSGNYMYAKPRNGDLGYMEFLDNMYKNLYLRGAGGGTKEKKDKGWLSYGGWGGGGGGGGGYSYADKLPQWMMGLMNWKI